MFFGDNAEGRGAALFGPSTEGWGGPWWGGASMGPMRAKPSFETFELFGTPKITTSLKPGFEALFGLTFKLLNFSNF